MTECSTQRFLLPAFVLSGLIGASSITGGCSCGSDTTGFGNCDVAGCGQDCSTNADCPQGLVCESGKCNLSSTTSSGSGGAAGSSGVLSGPVGSGGTQSAGTGGQGGACGEVTVNFAPQIPTVVLLIDQSGSMDAEFPQGSGVERWDAVYNALMDPATGPVAALQGQVRFGFTSYTGTNPGGTCPLLVQVMPPALNNYDAINAGWPATYIDDTPTGESISAIVPEIVAVTEPGPKLILLATDGDPDSCAEPDSNGTQPPKDLATAAAQAAYAQGIETVILAVGDEVNQFHQQDMANAGKGLPIPAPDPCDQINNPMQCAKTYQPSTQAELIAAFDEIINGKRTCVFTLDGQVVPGKECQGIVEVNGEQIPCNDPDGWKLNDQSTIEFTGSACDTIMSDPNVEITAKFPCDAAMSGSTGTVPN